MIQVFLNKQHTYRRRTNKFQRSCIWQLWLSCCRYPQLLWVSNVMTMGIVVKAMLRYCTTNQLCIAVSRLGSFKWEHIIIIIIGLPYFDLIHWYWHIVTCDCIMIALCHLLYNNLPHFACFASLILLLLYGRLRYVYLKPFKLWNDLR